MNEAVLLFIKGGGFFPFLGEGKKADRKAGRKLLFLSTDFILSNDVCRLSLTFPFLLKKQTLKVKLLPGFGCRFQTLNTG